MAFILQLYAPISENPLAFHRIVYVFICLKPKCQRTGKEIKILRAQLPRKNELYSFDPPGKEQEASANAKRTGLPKPLINESLIEIIYENKKITKKVQSFVDDGEDDEDLLLVYHKSEKEMEKDDDDEGGEELKDYDVPEREVEKRFLLFNYVVQKNPEHVIRYTRNEKCGPLWMHSKHPAIPDKCIHCGGKLCQEFQLMPKVFNVPQMIELDFESIIVYTCSQSCQVKDYAEEQFVTCYCDISESIHQIAKKHK
jgi:pre-rRNA-processing protein TSR4